MPLPLLTTHLLRKVVNNHTNNNIEKRLYYEKRSLSILTDILFNFKLVCCMFCPSIIFSLHRIHTFHLVLDFRLVGPSNKLALDAPESGRRPVVQNSDQFRFQALTVFGMSAHPFPPSLANYNSMVRSAIFDSICYLPT